MVRLSGAALLALFLFGCGDAVPESAGAGGSGPAAATVEAGASAVADSAGSLGAGAASLVLEGEGLRVFLAPSGSARPIPFGSTMQSAMDVLVGVLHVRPSEEGENSECGGHYAAWDNGLTVWSDGGRFVGWFVRGGDTTLTTATGAGVGSLRADWESGYELKVMESSLGVEFTAGGMAGLLESAESDARATHLWAGQVCLAR